MNTTHPPARVAYAWLVHLFTLTGMAWACLAMVALFQDRIALMWLWLGIALIVDGVDGTLARRAEVTTYAPGFDGALLDVVVDYLTWTFIPALFMFRHLPLGPEWVAVAVLVLVCTSSVFCYCNVNLKTHDNYFMGFPAAWNVVAVIMWILGTGPVVNVAVTIVLALLTVAPVTFVHPFRVSLLMPLNIAAAFGWIATTAILVAQHPQRGGLAEVLWWVCGVWLMGVGLYRTVRDLVVRKAVAE